MNDPDLSDEFPVLGPPSEPDPDRYTPNPVSPHCEATKDLLKWMRRAGFVADHLEVGKDQVLIHGLVDLFAKKPVEARAKVPPRFEEDQE